MSRTGLMSYRDFLMKLCKTPKRWFIATERGNREIRILSNNIQQCPIIAVYALVFGNTRIKAQNSTLVYCGHRVAARRLGLHEGLTDQIVRASDRPMCMLSKPDLWREKIIREDLLRVLGINER